MDYLHLIKNKYIREWVQRVAQNDPTLTELKDIIYVDANVLQAIGHALIGNTYLRKLHLRKLVLTQEAADALAQGMARSKIEILSLYGNCRGHRSQESSSTSSQSICDIFYRGVQSSTTIQELDLNQCLTDDDPGNTWRDALLGVTKITMFLPRPHQHGYVQTFSQVLSRTTLLRELSMDLRCLEADNITTLAHGLRQNTSIRSLCLANTGLNLLFAQGLNPNSAITKLIINQCNMDNGCISLLMDHWFPNCRMEELALSNDNIDATGALRLIQALDAYPTMLKLDLYRNYEIGYKGLQLIGKELENLQHLTHLDLTECSTWNDYLDAESDEAEAQTTACQQAGQALLNGIKHNHSITELWVNNNKLPESVEGKIHFYAALNKMGRYLLSAESDHGVALSVWCYIFAKCQHQANFGASLVYFYLKELPFLMQQPRRL